MAGNLTPLPWVNSMPLEPKALVSLRIVLGTDPAVVAASVMISVDPAVVAASVLISADPAAVAASVLMFSATLNDGVVRSSCALSAKLVSLSSGGGLTTGTIETLCVSVNASEKKLNGTRKRVSESQKLSIN